MEQFLIHGGKRLEGELKVNGAKNHALKLIPAIFLFHGTTTIHNLPLVEDVLRLLEIVEQIGGTVNRPSKHVVEITPPEQFDGFLSEELVPKLRASLVLLGPLLARYGTVILPSPGGDKIGRRPIDFFVENFERMGAKVKVYDEGYHFSLQGPLHGVEILFPRISVTGTEAAMMAAVLAEGTTVIKNAACEPEIVALATYLSQQGASIEGIGTHTLTIHGGSLLEAGDVTVIPDRIEAASFIMLAAATRSDILVSGCEPLHMEIPLSILSQMGVEMEVGKDFVHVQSHKKVYTSIDLVTHEYPGFPTDMQPPMTMLLTQAEGQSSIRETIFDGRLFYVDELRKMGADIILLDPYRALVTGPTKKIAGKLVTSPDLRAGLAMIIAALMAEGETIIQNIYQIDRGYADIEGRLRSIGADIKRIHA